MKFPAFWCAALLSVSHMAALSFGRHVPVDTAPVLARDAKSATFDYVIVGGGNAGLVAAMRLSADGKHSVAVVEAGGSYEADAGNITVIPAYESEFLDAPASIDWKITTAPQSQLGGRSILYSQGKTLGGSTARNGMAYQRGPVSSYQMWAETVGDDSYSWTKLLPFFQKSVTFTPPDVSLRGGPAVAYDSKAFSSSGGPLNVAFWNYYVPISAAIARGLASLGFKETGKIQSGSLLGYAQFPATIDPNTQTRDSSKTSFLDAILKSQPSSRNLHVFNNTLAKRILFRRKQAVGVSVVSGSTQYVLSAREEVILAAGVFRSPQLLMASGIGPEKTLSTFQIPVISNLGGVGQNMQDHPAYGTLFSVDAVTQHRLWNNVTFAAKALEEYEKNRSGPLTAFASNYILWEKFPKNAGISPSTRAVIDKLPADWPDVEYIFNTAGPATNTSGDVLSVGVVILKPTSHGSVTLSSSDTAQNPVVDVKWFNSETDLDMGVEALKRARLFANATGVLLGELSPGNKVQSDSDIREFIRSAASPSHHAVGTCKMGGKNDESAVVDNHGCVRGGVSSLRIIDASVMPILPPGQPMSTVYAIAEKLSADILYGHRC
ncbi:hypothetical protein FALCPG4_018077 [Fusarium falciforme]